MDPSIYKDYVLTMMFLKYLSNVWKDHRVRYEQQHADSDGLVDALMQQLLAGKRRVKVGHEWP